MMHQSQEKALASWAPSNAYRTDGEHPFVYGYQTRFLRSKATLRFLLLSCRPQSGFILKRAREDVPLLR
jgi:hypothetical protein